MNEALKILKQFAPNNNALLDSRCGAIFHKLGQVALKKDKTVYNRDNALFYFKQAEVSGSLLLLEMLHVHALELRATCSVERNKAVNSEHKIGEESDPFNRTGMIKYLLNFTPHYISELDGSSLCPLVCSFVASRSISLTSLLMILQSPLHSSHVLFQSVLFLLLVLSPFSLILVPHFAQMLPFFATSAHCAFQTSYHEGFHCLEK